MSLLAHRGCVKRQTETPKHPAKRKSNPNHPEGVVLEMSLLLLCVRRLIVVGIIGIARKVETL